VGGKEKGTATSQTGGGKGGKGQNGTARVRNPENLGGKFNGSSDNEAGEKWGRTVKKISQRGREKGTFRGREEVIKQVDCVRGESHGSKVRANKHNGFELINIGE